MISTGSGKQPVRSAVYAAFAAAVAQAPVVHPWRNFSVGLRAITILYVLFKLYGTADIHDAEVRTWLGVAHWRGAW